jgi:hypothetical protein
MNESYKNITHSITVRYIDDYGDLQNHVITGAGPLIYDDMEVEPIAVRRIASKGVAIKSTPRKGIFVLPHRIVMIWFEDTL